jgi:hypothetical protein
MLSNTKIPHPKLFYLAIPNLMPFKYKYEYIIESTPLTTRLYASYTA